MGDISYSNRCFHDVDAINSRLPFRRICMLGFVNTGVKVSSTPWTGWTLGSGVTFWTSGAISTGWSHFSWWSLLPGCSWFPRYAIATIKTPRAPWSNCANSSRQSWRSRWSRWSRHFANVCLKDGRNIVRLNLNKA